LKHTEQNKDYAAVSRYTIAQCGSNMSQKLILLIIYVCLATVLLKIFVCFTRRVFVFFMSS